MMLQLKKKNSAATEVEGGILLLPLLLRSTDWNLCGE